MKLCHTRSGLFLIPDDEAARLAGEDKAQIVEGLQASQVRFARSFTALADDEEEAARGYRRWDSLKKAEEPEEADEVDETKPRRRRAPRRYDRRDMEAADE